jgi:hypothetical protein
MANAPEADPPALPIGSAIAFNLGARAVTVDEVIRAAHFRGEVTAAWQDLLLKIACQEHAAAQSLKPDLDAIQARADQFRYTRDLITSEETEEWMEKHGIDQEHFSNHILRDYWKEVLGEKLAPEARPSADESELRSQLIGELFLTGAFDQMALELARRMASRQAGAPSDDDTVVTIEAQRDSFFSIMGIRPEDLAAWLESVGGDTAWFEEMLLIEAAYAQRSAMIVTEDGLMRVLRSRRLSLMRFEGEEIEFDNMSAAREALLCVRDDHLSMEEVAAESRYPYQQREFVLEELPEEWQTTVLSTPENGLAGPFSGDDLIRLFRIRRKIEPTLDDAVIREHLEESLVEDHFKELCSNQGVKMFL